MLDLYFKVIRKLHDKVLDFVKRYLGVEAILIAKGKAINLAPPMNRLNTEMRDGIAKSMNQLLATRRGSRPLTARPQVGFVLMAGTQGDYLEYLYLDRQNYSRVMQYVRVEDGRYIAAEADFYFYMDSGMWVDVAGPLAASWWILVLLFTGGVYVYRRLALARQAMWRGQG